MASFTTASANDVLNLILRNVALPWAGTTKYLSLHSATIGAAGGRGLAPRVGLSPRPVYHSAFAPLRRAATPAHSAREANRSRQRSQE